MTWCDTTDDTQAFLDSVTRDDLQSPEVWQKLTCLVRVLSDGEIFPVRARYGESAQATIGANHLTSDTPLWFTLADCIAAKLASGKTPKVIEAKSFAPMGKQAGLNAVNISGNPAYHVDPRKTDFFKRTIELRQSVKAKRDAVGADRDTLDIEQNTLKIIANATSYGIYVEVNVADLGKFVKTQVHSSTADTFAFETDKAEEPGSYFHPLLATLICGAARLMLAVTENLSEEQGLDWCFCDTDSMALAKPSDMAVSDFQERVQHIVDWFGALNPYDFGGSILQIEKVNYALNDGKTPEPLYCWAISSKRYALFNIGDDGAPIIRKASAHGLGQFIAPYDEHNPSPHISAPKVKLSDIGVDLWQHDFWWQIISAILNGHPDQVSRDFHANMQLPATSRYGATTPELLRWFKSYNLSRTYVDQVKPFNFMLAMSADPFVSQEYILRNKALATSS